MKRPRAAVTSSSSSSGCSQERQPQRLKQPIFDPRHSFYVLSDKLPVGEKEFVESIIRTHGGSAVAAPDRATYILTAVKGAARIRRTLPQSLEWRSKTFVHLQWIHDCVAAQCPLPIDPFVIDLTPPGPLAGRISSSPPSRQASPQVGVRRARPTEQEPYTVMTQQELQANYTEEPLACFRWCPLVCINDDLVRELAVIKQGRKLLDGDGRSALSYSRAISGFKAYPWKITKGVPWQVPGVADTIRAAVDEFLDTGRMSSAERYRQSSRLQQLVELEQIHGVGASTARKLQAQGLSVDTVTNFDTNWLEDFAKRIPRQEVEEIAVLVAEYLEQIVEGAEYTICGGYRRGKPFSNDIDIIMTHQTAGQEKYVLGELVTALERDNILVKNLYQTNTWSKRPPGAQNFHTTGMDPLDKCFAVFLPPRRGSLQQIHRRVDLIFAPWKYYWTAVVGWTGSTQFERDLRIHAAARDMKFDSGGLTSQKDSHDILARSERHVFEILSLPYIPPIYRNADQNP